MLLGALLALLATAAQNGSVVYLTVAARSGSERTATRLLVGVVRRRRGIVGMAMNTAGWLFELWALTRISLTLDRIIMTAGFGLLLLLVGRELKEPIGGREIVGVLAIAVGIVAVGLMPVGRGGLPLGTGGWLILVVVFLPLIVAPSLLRRAGVVPNSLLGAGAAGLSFALTGMFTKGMADFIDNGRLVPVLLLLIGVALIDTLGFMDELLALRHGQASVVIPVLSAARIVVPIALAPFFFGETWPHNALDQTIMAAGIGANLFGVIILARKSAAVIRQTTKV